MISFSPMNSSTTDSTLIVEVLVISSCSSASSVAKIMAVQLVPPFFGSARQNSPSSYQLCHEDLPRILRQPASKPSMSLERGRRFPPLLLAHGRPPQLGLLPSGQPFVPESRLLWYHFDIIQSWIYFSKWIPSPQRLRDGVFIKNLENLLQGSYRKVVIKTVRMVNCFNYHILILLITSY